MIRKFVAFGLGALLLASTPFAQRPAKASLYTRVEAGVVRAALEIALDPGWHIYHGPTQADLGHPKAVGSPTVVTLSGTGIEWSPVRFPEPIKIDQSDLIPGAFILGHEGKVVLYAAGRLADGASGADVGASLKGLVCEVSCIPYREEVASNGSGPDALFASFPADLSPPSAAAAGDPATSAPASTGKAEQSEVPKEDKVEIGSADTTLYTRIEGREVRAALEIVIEPGWHLYHTAEDLGHGEGEPVGKPTSVVLHGAGVTWQEPVFPEPIRIDQSDFNGKGAYINAHEGTIHVYAKGTLADGAELDPSGKGLWGEIEGQTCEEICIDYEETFVSHGRGPESAWSGFDAAFGRPGGDDESASGPGAKKGLLAFLLAAIGGGLFALVMPCTYPMIPITISFFTKQAEKRGGTPLALSLAYGAGIVLIFVIVGLAFGSLIKPFAANPIVNLVLGLAFVYFALVLFGVLHLEPPRFLMNVAGTASMKGGFLGVFLMGATLVITSFTCTAPFVGTLLSIGATGGNAGRVALGMAVFGLTMAVPFVLLSMFPGKLQAMPRSGEWMNTVKVTFGFVELAAALKFISNADLVLQWNWLSRELFLLLWVGIFGTAAIYLFGMIRLEGSRPEISPVRMVIGLVCVLFALYCANGAAGSVMDPVMTAIIPNYSTRPLVGAGGEAQRKHAIVVDDYDAARKRAREEGKLLLVNFTGYT